MKPNYDKYRLYLECEILQDKFNLDDTEYIVTEFLYNLTSRNTAILQHGIDMSVAYNRIREYLLKYMDIAIPKLTSKQKAQKEAVLKPIFASLVEKNVITRLPDFKYRNGHYTAFREMYEFSEEATRHLKNRDTYIKASKNITTSTSALF